MEEGKESEETKPMEEDVHEAKEEIQNFPKGDLILVVEGRELYVNKDILKEASPVFRAMLESDFKEGTQDRIELPGKSYEAMVEFLKCTYTFIDSNITVNNVFKILPLAEEYQTSLKKRCEEFMINILREKESYFIHRTDSFKCEQHGLKNSSGEKTTFFIKYHSANTYQPPPPVSSDFSFGQQVIAASTGGFKFGGKAAISSQEQPSGGFNFGTAAYPHTLTIQRLDATSVDDFTSIGFGKNGFEFGNTVPAEIVIRYILEAEKYGCDDFLKIAIQYVAMRQFSHFEASRRFSDISMDTRLKITMLRLRILENYQSNKLDLKDLLFRK